MSGKIVRLDERGFGFVSLGGIDYFFHRTAVEEPGFDSLREGDAVEFEGDRQSARGPRASAVRVIG